MKKTNLMALTVVFALILNLMMPFMRVIASSSYTITFEAVSSFYVILKLKYCL